MSQHRYSIAFAITVHLAFASSTPADDPRTAAVFEKSIYPPGGFSVKKSKPTARPDPKNPKNPSMVGMDGKFTDWAQWYYNLGSDPQAFQAWWEHYWADGENWKVSHSPVTEDTGPINQGHRIIGYIGQFHKLLNADPQIDDTVKANFTNDEWKAAVEKIIGDCIDARGWLKVGKHEFADGDDLPLAANAVRCDAVAVAEHLHARPRSELHRHAPHRTVGNFLRGSLPLGGHGIHQRPDRQAEARPHP